MFVEKGGRWETTFITIDVQYNRRSVQSTFITLDFHYNRLSLHSTFITIDFQYNIVKPVTHSNDNFTTHQFSLLEAIPA